MVEEKRIPEGYKQTEVGVIPEDWVVETLKEVGFFKKGRGIARDELISRGVPCVLYGEIYTKYHDVEKKLNSRISKITAQKSEFIKKGDVLFAGSGETLEEIGKCFSYIGETEAYAGGDILIMTPKKHDPIFLGYILNAPLSVKQKAKMGQGSSVVHIYTSNLKEVTIPVPKAEEQRAIATALTDTDNLLQSLQKLIDKKKKVKQGAMQELLTGKKRLPGFEGEWEKAKIGEICEIIAGVSKSRYINSNGKFIIVDMGSVSTDGRLIGSKKTDLSNDVLARYDLIMPKDDIGGGKIIGKTALIDKDHTYVLGDHVYKLNSSTQDTIFLHYLINSYHVNKSLKMKVVGSAQLGLAKRSVSEQDILIPQINEQRAIATILSDMDTEIKALEKKYEKLQAVKKGMMQELLTGRVRLI